MRKMSNTLDGPRLPLGAAPSPKLDAERLADVAEDLEMIANDLRAATTTPAAAADVLDGLAGDVRVSIGRTP